MRYPPLALSFTQAHLCDTPFCYVSRDICAIPHKKTSTKKVFAILSLQVSRDMKSIAAGPLSPGAKQGLDGARDFFGKVSRGNTIRGNRTERFLRGENLPLRGSLRGSLRGRVSEVF